MVLEGLAACKILQGAVAVIYSHFREWPKLIQHREVQTFSNVRTCDLTNQHNVFRGPERGLASHCQGHPFFGDPPGDLSNFENMLIDYTNNDTARVTNFQAHHFIRTNTNLREANL
jgi:hypothetical protein